MELEADDIPWTIVSVSILDLIENVSETKMGRQFLMLLLSCCFLLAVSCVWVPEKALTSAERYRERGKSSASNLYSVRESDVKVINEKSIKTHKNIDAETTRKVRDKRGEFTKPTKQWWKPTTESPASQDPSFNCFPYDSCANRCGENHTGPTVGYVCNCDQLCEIYRDCCADYRHFCTKKDRFLTDEIEKIRDDVDDFLPLGYFPAKSATTHAPSTTTNILTTSTESLESHPNKFECVNIEEYLQATVWVRTKCDPSCLRSGIASKCQNTHDDGILSKLPVQGIDGFTYRNIYCAQCNKVQDATYWISLSACFTPPPINVLTDPESLAQYLSDDCTTMFQVPQDVKTLPRKCVSSVDTCGRQKPRDVDNSQYIQWMKGCYESYQSLVIGQILKSGTDVYKNANCAMCNGVEPEKLECAYPRYELEELVPINSIDLGEELGLFRRPPVQITNDDNQVSLVPYAVITNYNEEGDGSTFIVDTKSGNVIPVPQHCDEGMVFDPYQGGCRQVFCAEGFVLVGNECVFELPPLPTSHEHDGPRNRTLDDQITITISMSVSIVLGSEGTPSPEMKDDFIDLIANWFNVTEWNFTQPEEPIALNVSFWTVAEANLTSNGLNFLKFTVLMDNVNTTVHNISRVFGDLVKFGIMKISVYIDGVPLEVDLDDFERFTEALRGNLIPLKLFFSACGSGNATLYLPDEVTFIEGGDCPLIYVEKIDKEYNCREMLLLNYDPEVDINQQNFSMITCEGMPTLDTSCVRIRLNASEYTILNNGSIVIISSGEIFGPKEYLVVDGNSIEICTELTPFIKDIFVVKFNFSDAQWIILNVGCSISLVGLVVTFVTYALFSELRTLPGLNLMTLTSILFVNNLLLLTSARETSNKIACTSIAICVHFFNLSSFFWMNVMTYDLYKTFGRKRTLKNALKNKIAPLRQYMRYSIYAWGCPTIVVFISIFIDFCDSFSFKIGYGQYFSCTISYPLAFLFMIGIPLVFTMSSNIAMFLRTVCVLHNSREARELARSAVNQNSQSDIKLAVKMSTVMGFSWSLSAIAVFLNGAGIEGTVVWYLFIIFNSLQGTFISVTFVFNRRVYGLYEKRFCKKRVRNRARAQTLRNHAVLTTTLTSSNTSSSGSSALSRISSRTAIVSTGSRFSSILDQVNTDSNSTTQEIEIYPTSENSPQHNFEQTNDDMNDDVFVSETNDMPSSNDVKEFDSRDTDSISHTSNTTSNSYTSEVTRC